MDFVVLGVVAATIVKVVSMVKYLLAGDRNGAITQAVAWGVGIGLAFLLASSDLGAAIAVNGRLLGTLNGGSVILLGIALGSTGSLTKDALKSLDNSDSAKEPPIVEA